MSVQTGIEPSRVGVIANGDDKAVMTKACELARTMSLDLVCEGDEFTTYDFLLVVDFDGVSLRDLSIPGVRPVRVDFAGGATGYRRLSGGGRRQLIGRALGLQSGGMHVVDATAGLGRDAFLMACLGCHVTMIERNPVIGAILQDGLRRGVVDCDAAVREIVSRMSLVVGDAREKLQLIFEADRPDVIYVDPMHPPRQKSAAVKKELRVCRKIVGDDVDAVELLASARSVETKRVVVKRAKLAEPILPDVSTTYMGRSVRYDVYMKNLAS